jgi:hypothetical protein
MKNSLNSIDARCAMLASASMVSARCARLYGTDDSGIPMMADEIIALRTAELANAAQVAK